MRLPKLTKAQMKEALDKTPMYELLNVDKGSMTAKQFAFCDALARGETKAGAYRKAYNTKAKPNTIANNGYKMANRNDIKTMTEAIKLAIEWEKQYTAGQIRSLVAHRLTVEALAEDSNPSVRVNALKALGTVAGVDSFIHRSETKVVKDSDKAKDELLSMLKQALNDNARTIDQSDSDIDALMREIEGGLENAGGEISDPHTPLLADGTPESILHTIPDTQSPSKSKGTPSSISKDDNDESK